MYTKQDITKEQARELIQGIRDIIIEHPITDTIRPYFYSYLRDEKDPSAYRPPVCYILHDWEQSTGKLWSVSDHFENLADSGGRTLFLKLRLKFTSQDQYEQCTLFTQVVSLLEKMGLTPNKIYVEKIFGDYIPVELQQSFRIVPESQCAQNS